MWRRLSRGSTPAEIIADLPDEAHSWADREAGRLLHAHRTLLTRFRNEADAVPAGLTPAERARFVQRGEHPAAVFMLLRDDDPAEYAWKQVRPVYEPFRSDAAATDL